MGDGKDLAPTGNFRYPLFKFQRICRCIG